MNDSKTKTVSFVDEESEKVLRRNCDHPNPSLTDPKEKGQKALAKFLAPDVNERRKNSTWQATLNSLTPTIPAHLRPQTLPLSGGVRFFCDNFVSSMAKAKCKSS